MQPSITSEALANESASPQLAQPHARSDAPVSQVFGGLLAGPIIPTLLKLAAPTVVVLVVQTFVSVIETYFVGFLGKDALAGVALVFPVLMLMTMMSNGALGGGAASAVARALGSGRRQDADALVLHAVLLATLFGLAFLIGVLGGGRVLYRLLGGSGDAIEAALQYSRFVFGGAVLIWVVNLLTATLRGAGEVRIPALVIFAGAFIVVPLSPALIFGLGPVPQLGIAGAGAAVIFYYVLAGVALVAYMRSRHSPIKLVWAALEWRLFKDVLGVGGISAIGTLQINLTVAVVTGLVGPFGTRRACRLRHGVPARLCADPALVRPWHGCLDDGRRQYRCAPGRAGATDRLDRSTARGSRHRNDWRHCCAVSASVDWNLQL